MLEAKRLNITERADVIFGGGVKNTCRTGTEAGKVGDVF